MGLVNKDASVHCYSLSAKTRLAGLESLRQAFSSKVLYEFLRERRLTLSDCIERSLKKGEFKQTELCCYVYIQTNGKLYFMLIS